LSSAGRN